MARKHDVLDIGHREQPASGSPARWIWAALAGVIAAGVVVFGLRTSALPVPVLRLVAGSEVRAIHDRGGGRMIYRVSDPSADADGIARTARLLAARVEAIDDGSVSVTGRDITVEAVGVAHGAVDIVARELMRRGELSFHLAVDSSPRMDALCRRAMRTDGPVSCETDAWTHDHTGAEMRASYLAADSPAAIEGFLAQAEATEPALAPDPDRIILLERMAWDPQPSGSASWRTYELERQAALDGEGVADAWIYHDPITGRPAVLLSFTADGAQRWYETTSRNVGRKIAIVLDGTVSSAPVIHDAIAGGRATITLAGASQDELLGKAQATVAVLRSHVTTGGVAPVKLELLEARPVVSSIHAWQRAAAIALLCLFAGLGMFALVLALEWRAQPLDVVITRAPGAGPWGRLALTVAALAALHVAPGFLALPGISLDALAIAGMSGDPASGSMINVLTLGITPILAAFLLVEITALAVPRWRPLRICGPEGRARLLRATAIVTVIMALLQGYGISIWLEGLQRFGVDVVTEPGLASRLLITLTLTGGVMVLWIVAGLLHRHGLGNGFSLVILAGLLQVPAALDADPTLAPVEAGAELRAALTIAGWLVIFAATSRVLRARAAGTGMRLPTCGILPAVDVIAVVPAVLTSAVILERALGPGPAQAQETLPPAMRLVLTIVLAFGYAWLFSRPRALPAGARVLGGERAQMAGFWRATILSALYVTGATAVALLAERAALPVSIIEPVLVTAIVMDLVAEWRARRRCRDLVAVWPIHRVQVADLAVATLQRAGIDAHTRGRYHRTLLHFFAPFVPIELQVPAERASEAESLLRSMLGTGAAAGTDAAAGTAPRAE